MHRFHVPELSASRCEREIYTSVRRYLERTYVPQFRPTDSDGQPPRSARDLGPEARDFLEGFLAFFSFFFRVNGDGGVCSKHQDFVSLALVVVGIVRLGLVAHMDRSPGRECQGYNGWRPSAF
jgi:hypothetical protein